MKKSLLFLLLFLVFYSCGIFRSRINLNRGGANRDAYHETLRFKQIKDKVILPVTVNGQVRRFIFDTGAPTIISESLQEELQYDTMKAEEISDVHRNTGNGTFVKTGSLFLGDVEFNNVPALVNDLSDFPWNCFRVDGFIGSNLLRNSVVQINTDAEQFILASEAAGLQNLDAESSMKLDRQSTPYIRLGVAGENDKYVLFDSGSDNFVNISLEYFETLQKQHRPFDVEKTGYGNGIMGLFGTGKPGKVYRLKMDSLRIGQITITDPVVEVNNTIDRVGAKLLQYGVVTLDYRNEKFYFFSPEDQSIPFENEEESELGFRPVLRDDTLRVGLVWEHSLVDSLGLEPGNEIIRINEYHFRDSLKHSFCKLLRNDSLINSEVLDIRYIDERGNFKRIKMRRKRE